MDADDIVIMGLTLPELGHRALFLLVVVVIAYVADKVASRALRRVLDVSNVPAASIIVNLARVGIWAIALTAVLQPVFGIEPNAFITALGVTGVAISLGVQDTISNLIGGLFLMVGKVITIGDDVTIGTTTGKVTDVDLRSTTVRLRGGNTEIIPNSVLNKTALAKLAPSNAGSCSVPVYVRHGADLDAVTSEIVSLATEALGDMLDERFGVSVLFEGFDAYGTKGSVWVHVRDDVVFAKAQDVVARALQGHPWLAEA